MRQELASGLIVNIKQLPDGRSCIHWLMEDETGPIKQGAEIQLPPGFSSKMAVIRTRFVGRIACNPLQNSVLSRQVGDEVFVCQRSEDVRAATCQACLATPEAEEERTRLGVGTLDAMQAMEQKANS